MTEKNEYTAAIRGKGLDATGVTEELAQQMYNTLGRTTMAIVELKHARQINDEATGRKVELAITLLEPSTDKALDDHLRELTRTMHQNRVLTSADDQLQIETLDDTEPTVEQVIAAGQQHIATTDDELPDPDTQDEDDEGEPWAYDEPEGGTPTPIGSPFATSSSTGDPAA